MRILRSLAAICVSLSVSSSLAPYAHARPNIVIIMADDMGFSDIGCYGGEIRTPNVDRLAENGLRFTQFYNAARCCPTRASLLTGLYAHQTGIGHMTSENERLRFDLGYPGYRGFLNRSCVTIAEALKPAGYRTLMAGKWHVGTFDGMWPVDRGFDEFYGLIRGASNFFRPAPRKLLVRNRQRVIPGEDYYTTDAFTEHSIEFVPGCRGRRRPALLPVPLLHRAALAAPCVAGGRAEVPGPVHGRMGKGPRRPARPPGARWESSTIAGG